MRLKRSCAIVVLLEHDRFVFHDFLGQKTFLANATALEIVRRLHAWTDLEGLFGLLPGYTRQSVVKSVRELIGLGVIIEEDSDAAAREEDFEQNWLWGPYAAAYHFGARGGDFLAQEDVDTALRQQAKFMPSPPLYQTNDHPQSDVVLPTRTEFPEPYRTLAARRTQRTLADRPIGLEALADCLLVSMAITGVIEFPGVGDLPLKMTPSGGGRNPFEAFVCARSVEGLAAGTYHYSAMQRTLGVVREGPPPPFPELLGGQKWTANGAAVIFLVAHFERPMWKYHHCAALGATLIEAGHIAQNIMLAATSHGLAANATGALSADRIEETLRLQGVTQSVAYGLVLGAPAKVDAAA